MEIREDAKEISDIEQSSHNGDTKDLFADNFFNEGEFPKTGSGRNNKTTECENISSQLLPFTQKSNPVKPVFTTNDLN